MSTLPCKGCRGLCCGPVPVSDQEVKRIKKKVKTMPVKLRANLRNQARHYGTCIFYNLDQDVCGIHAVRPAVCRAFGFHRNLVCVRSPETATKKAWTSEESHVGVLSVDFTWKDFD